MKLLSAHAHFSTREDGGRSVLPNDIEIEAIDGLDPIPALATAAIVLSGQLEECQSNPDLNDAAAHFSSLLASGIVDPDTWSQEAEKVINEVLRWGDALTASSLSN